MPPLTLFFEEFLVPSKKVTFFPKNSEKLKFLVPQTFNQDLEDGLFCGVG
jgi:hypothetical protein